MKAILAVLLLSAAAAHPVLAAEGQPAEWGSVKLKSAPAGPVERAPISIELRTAEPAAAASAPVVLPVPGAVALPAIPAAGPAPTPSASMPDTAAAQLPSTLQPGQPVKQYPTLEAAAKDGIDPLAKKGETPALPPMPAAKAFDPTDLQSYIALARKHLGPNGPFIALGGVLALLVGFVLLARRGR